jgi:hypothetical protein
MRSPSTFVILLVTLLTSATAAPQLIPVIGGLLGGIPVVGAITGYLGNVLNLLGVLYAAPPPFLLTKNKSPVCKNVNNGMSPARLLSYASKTLTRDRCTPLLLLNHQRRYATRRGARTAGWTIQAQSE